MNTYFSRALCKEMGCNISLSLYLSLSHTHTHTTLDYNTQIFLTANYSTYFHKMSLDFKPYFLLFNSFEDDRKPGQFELLIFMEAFNI